LITLGYDDLTCTIDTSWASVAVPGLDKPDGDQSISAPRFEIDGTEGTLSLNCDGTMHLFTDSHHQQWQFSRDTMPESHAAAQQHFIDCLESGAEFETNGPETLKTMALVDACYLSAEEGRTVEPNRLL
jgi:predicted dehydrogenase